MAKTLANLRDFSQYILGSTTVWSAAEVERHVAEGLKQLCAETGCFVRIKDLNDTVGVATVDLNASCVDANAQYEFIVLERACWDLHRIEPLDPMNLQLEDPAWLTQRGNVEGFIFDGDGPRTIRKWRVPAASATNKFRLEYRRSALSLATAGTNIELPERYAKRLRYYVLWKCYERDGDGQDLDLANHYHERWRELISIVRAQKSASRIARVGRMGEPTHRRGRPPKPQLPWNYPRR